jgi:hypothetical protein
MSTMNIDAKTAVAAGLACPLCHTVAPALTDAALSAGADWRCAVCHQMWNARRLATVAAYAEYCAARAAAIVVPLMDAA